MTDIKINNMVKFCTLYLLANEPKHGYDLMKELEEKLGRRISASNVYPFLSNLRKNKLINHCSLNGFIKPQNRNDILPGLKSGVSQHLLRMSSRQRKSNARKTPS